MDSRLFSLNSIWHGRGYFYPLVLLGSDFVSCFFFQKISNIFGGENLHQSAHLVTLPSSLSLIENVNVLKMSIFLALKDHARQGYLNQEHMIFDEFYLQALVQKAICTSDVGSYLGLRCIELSSKQVVMQSWLTLCLSVNRSKENSTFPFSKQIFHFMFKDRKNLLIGLVNTLK